MPTVLLILLFTEVTATVSVTLLLLLLCYYCCYITVATDNLCRGSLLSGAAKLTIHLLRLINILWLPLCRIKKIGFYFPRRLLRSPILVGHHPAGALIGEGLGCLNPGESCIELVSELLELVVGLGGQGPAEDASHEAFGGLVTPRHLVREVSILLDSVCLPHSGGGL